MPDVRLVRAVLADGHTGATVHEIALINETNAYNPAKRQLLYVELAGLPAGRHQLVVGEHHDPLGILDFPPPDPLRGQLITHFPCFLNRPAASNPRFVDGRAIIPVHLDGIFLGAAILTRR